MYLDIVDVLCIGYQSVVCAGVSGAQSMVSMSRKDEDDILFMCLYGTGFLSFAAAVYLRFFEGIVFLSSYLFFGGILTLVLAGELFPSEKGFLKHQKRV